MSQKNHCVNCIVASFLVMMVKYVRNSLPPSVVDFSSLGKKKTSLASVDLLKCVLCDSY